jgi:O-antigen ligase
VATGGILGGLFAGVAAGELTLSGHALAVAALLWLAIPFVCWRRPASGVLLLVASALLIEEYPSIPGLKTITESIPLFKSLSVGVGLTGVAVNPAEILIATVAATWVLKAVAEGNMALPRSHLAVGVGLLLVAVIAGEAHGQATGSNFVASLWEVRPWFYLSVAYLLAAQLIRTQRLVWAVLWTLVIASGLKGLEGTIRWVVSLRGLNPPAEQILGHEESVFLGLFILLTAALWLLGIKGRLRQVATALLPFVLFTNLANNRRTTYVILGAGIAIMIAVAWARSPQQRWMTGGVAVALLAAMALYLPVFWNRTGLLAQPASAIRSAVDPSQRDAASNLYRVIENTDLGIDIHEATPLGTGFGKPIGTPISLIDISKIDSFIVYEPHNSILYLWLRLGFPGAIAFWFMIGAAIVAACKLARERDLRLTLVGSVALFAISSYLIEGWYDQGLVSLRVALLVGALLGTMEAARRLVPPPPAQ